MFNEYYSLYIYMYINWPLAPIDLGGVGGLPWYGDICRNWLFNRLFFSSSIWILCKEKIIGELTGEIGISNIYDNHKQALVGQFYFLHAEL